MQVGGGEIVGLVGVFMTAAYMTRATYLVFFGQPRGAAAGVHEEEHVDEIAEAELDSFRQSLR